jgi:hypothetical protein
VPSLVESGLDIQLSTIGERIGRQGGTEWREHDRLPQRGAGCRSPYPIRLIQGLPAGRAHSLGQTTP